MESLEIFFYSAQRRGFKKLCEQFPLSILQLMAYAAREKKDFWTDVKSDTYCAI